MHLVGVRSTPTFFVGKVNDILLFEKLVTICNDLNEVFNMNIKLNEERLEQMSLTAKFENQNIDSILETIAYTLDLEIEKYKDYILLK